MTDLQAAILLVQLHIPGSRSLKDKRRVIRSILERARSRFNVSASEVDFLDSWQRAGLAFSSVSREGDQIRKTFQQIRVFIEGKPDTEILQFELEWLV